MAKDKAKAILSYATPNPVGPYRLVTPPTPAGPSQTKTPVLPVVGGSLVNVPLPQMPTRTSNGPAQDVGQRKQVNVPKLPMAEKLKSDPVKEYWRNQDDYEKSWSIAEQYLNRDENSPLSKRYKRALEIGSVVTYDRNGNQMKVPSRSTRKNLIDSIMDDVSDLTRNGVTADEAYNILNAAGGNLIGLQISGEKYRRARDERHTSSWARSRMADLLTNEYKTLNKAGKETFLALLPEWTGTLQELRDAAASLSK